MDYCIGLGVVEHQTAIADSAVNGCTAHINCNPVVSCSFGFVFGCRGHNAPYPEKGACLRLPLTLSNDN